MVGDITIANTITSSFYLDNSWLKDVGSCVALEESNGREGKHSLPLQILADDCLDNCNNYTDATACEYDNDIGTCFYFTSDVVSGSGNEPYYCWTKIGDTKIKYLHQ